MGMNTWAQTAEYLFPGLLIVAVVCMAFVTQGNARQIEVLKREIDSAIDRQRFLREENNRLKALLEEEER